ncbi:MAG: IMP dehydrogenase [Candidatus Aenigmarchaeota archaeon]|nr:IMP dehydrogenase [Candidatus Aenigmarchaeota archaeon]
MVRLSPETSFSLRDFFIQPGWTPAGLTYDKVDLSVQLPGGVVLRYPFIAADMACVSGYDMTLECARNGLMAVVPASFPIEEQADIIRRVKAQEVKRGDLEFQDPVRIDVTSTVEQAMRMYDEFGHSTIPICDSFRRLRGVFRYRDGITGDTSISLERALSNGDPGFAGSIAPFDKATAVHGRQYCTDEDSPEFVHERMREQGISFMPIIDRNGVLQQLAFVYKFNGYAVGAAIHTHPGWKDRARAAVDAGADTMFTTASSCKSDYLVAVAREFKELYPGKPLITGNGVDLEGFNRACVDVGAAGFKEGMGSGGSCITTHGRGVGRGIYTALKEVSDANEGLGEDRKVIIGDGGIGTRRLKKETQDGKVLNWIEHDARTIGVALAFSDAVMMGTGFNILEEAAGNLLAYRGERFRGRWGEGSRKARTLQRYGIGERVKRAAIEEGIEDYVSVQGRLKPLMEKLGTQLQVTLTNVGAKDLKEFREKVVLEFASPNAIQDAGV